MGCLRFLCVAGVLPVFVLDCSSRGTGGVAGSPDVVVDATIEGGPRLDASEGEGSVERDARIEGAPPPDSSEDGGTFDDAAHTEGSVPGGGDAGPDTDATSPCVKSLFCDNFEEYAAGGLPSPTWGANQSGGSLVVDTTRSHSGKQSVKVSAGPSTGYRSILISLSKAGVVPIANNHLFGTMAFYLDSSPTTSVHWTFIDGFGATSAGYHAFYRYGGQTPAANGNTLMGNYDTPDSYGNPPVGPSSDCWLHSTTVVPTAVWSCAEWEFDGPNNTMRFWLDGAAVADLTMTGTGQGCVHQPGTFTWLAPTFSRIDLGWESYQADAARTIWIDDVAIGAVRLGCAP
jgi:hypothetical protein